jgi:CelD/BcsL family acetyltransferase involved in cellulose biosynthesis/peptidoglycan/xylan/chitin deacetylase (PgdA/CDA1 family)/GNAT superfamily N-acetyltransferase
MSFLQTRDKSELMKVLIGREALELVGDPGFAGEWQRLFTPCLWATVFQSHGFVSTWYDCYSAEFTPVIVYSFDKKPWGILPLALRGKSLVVAGAGQAEYQAWLSPDADAGFLVEAMRALRDALSFETLEFRYLPPGIPLPSPDSLFAVQAHARPLMKISTAALQESLRKKSNKSRLNRMRAKGELSFAVLDGSAELEQYIDSVAELYDVRQCAAHNARPFTDDPHKRAFQLGLARCGLLHSSVLKCGNQAIGAHLGAKSHNTVHLGVLAHSPFYAPYSPNKFLLLYLGLQLAAEGIEYLDLTPGGDPWKENFANEHDTVYTLKAFSSASQLRRYHLRRQVRSMARGALKFCGTTPAAARRAIDNFRHGMHFEMLGRLRRWLWSRQEMLVYCYPAAEARKIPKEEFVKRDCLPDLLAFQPTEHRQTRHRFLPSALERLELGLHHVYTRTEGGRLVHYGWLAERQTQTHFPSVGADFTFPPNTAVLSDYYTIPEARGQGYYTRSLRQMLRDAAAIPGTEYIYLNVLADNWASRRVVEKVGFRHVFSIKRHRVLGCSLSALTEKVCKRNIKKLLYKCAKAFGLFRFSSLLTRGRLRILCYHGFHDSDAGDPFAPKIFISLSTFRRRLEFLKAKSVTVLPLSDAIGRLQAGTLPPCSVAITIDDGFFSTLQASRLLSDYRLPATVYVTTYYVLKSVPIFRLAIRYILWKTACPAIDVSRWLPQYDRPVDISQQQGRTRIIWELIRYGESLPAESQRSDLASDVGRQLGVDYEQLVQDRSLSLLTAGEITSLANLGIDIQLHTHRHRFPVQEDVAVGELEDNRKVLAGLLNRQFDHFCYPSGIWSPAVWPALRRGGIISATTCDRGLNTGATHLLGLKRIPDNEDLSDIEFEAEIAGFAELMRFLWSRWRARTATPVPAGVPDANVIT